MTTPLDSYVELIGLLGRVHRSFLEAVKREIELPDLNNVQALMLFNIGDAELTVGDLTARGCYLGANVTYNLKKLVENGYLVQEKQASDRRISHVRLTPKGRQLRDRLHQMYCRDAGMAAIAADRLSSVLTTLRHLDALWSDGLMLPVLARSDHS